MRQIFLLLLLFLLTSAPARALIHQNAIVKNQQVNIIRINKATLQNKLSVAFTINSLEQEVHSKNALLAVNLSYFNIRTYKVCGFLTIDGKEISKKNVYNRPYFLIKNNGDFYIDNKDLTDKNDIKYLASGGSYILKNGVEYITYNHFSDAFLNNKVNRTIIGIDKWGNFCIVIIKKCSVRKAAVICKKLHLVDGINFDGGTSTQLYYKKHILKSSRIVPVKLLVRS